jgi:hypothetical protein
MSAENMRLPESVNHSPVKEYRVTKDGKIEVRLLDRGSGQESNWTELSPELLSSHVRRNTAVARWLERSLGWRRLLWACVGEEPDNMKNVAGQHDSHAACRLQ